MNSRLLLAWSLLSLAALGLGLAPATQPLLPFVRYYALPDTDSTAQQIAVVTGDSLMGFVENGETVQVFIGRVHGLQDSTTLQADWAKRFVERERVLFTGEVRIVDKGDSLFADTVFYDEASKIGRATGNVRLADGEVIAYAPSGEYFIDEKRIRFGAGLRLVDEEATITGEAGTYWTEEKRAEIDGNVRLRNVRTYMEADSLTYHREEEKALARGNVFIERLGLDQGEVDSTRRTVMFSQWAYSEEPAGYALVRGRPLLMQLRQDSASVDTLVVEALELESTEQDALRRVVALGAVRYWQYEMAAVADSMVYERVEESAAAPPNLSYDGPNPAEPATRDTVVQVIEEIWLYRDPMLWVHAAQVSGDTIRAQAQEDQADSLFVWGNAFIARLDSVLDRVHQARGKMLTASFEDDSTRVFVITSNAETIYFRKGEDDERDGALHVTGDEAILRLRGDEPEALEFGSNQGIFYPESALPDPFELEGFRWVPEERPSNEMLLRDPRVIAWLACGAEGRKCQGQRTPFRQEIQ